MSDSSSTTPTAFDGEGSSQLEATKAPHTKSNAVKQQPRKNTSLIDTAVSHVRKFEKKESEHEHSRRDIAFHAVAGIYVLLREAEQNEEIRNTLVNASKTKPRGGKLSAGYCVQAVLAISKSSLVRSTRWDWTRAVEALIISEIELNIQAAVDWFKHGEVFAEGEGELSGFVKALSVVKRSKADQPTSPGVEARLNNAKSKRKEVWETFITPQRDQPLSKIDLGSQTNNLPDGAFLLLVEKVKSQLTLMNTTLNDEAILRSLIPKKPR